VYEKHRAKLGNLYFTRYSPKTITPNKIDQDISDAVLRYDKQVDVVVVDYPDLLKNPNSTDNEAKDGGALMEDMRSIAQKHNVAMWTASQMNRSAMSAEIRNVGHVEGGFRKWNSCELVMSINQTPEEYQQGFIRGFLDKVRNKDSEFIEMLGFKVIGEKMRIRDYKDNEEAEHNRILREVKEGNSNAYRKKKADSTIEKPNYAESINLQLEEEEGVSG
jgi:hypothetical protein